MKRIIVIFLFLLGAGAILFFGIETYQKYKEKKQVSLATAQMPAFIFYRMDGSSFSKDNLIKDKNVLFVFFNPDCEYCQMEARDFFNHREQFSRLQILFISSAEITAIREFSEKYGLNQLPNVAFLQDREETFYDLFKVKGIPYMVMYQASGEKINTYKGVVSIEKILKDVP